MKLDRRVHLVGGGAFGVSHFSDSNIYAVDCERSTVLIDAPSFTASRLYDPDATPTLYVIEPERGVTLVSSGFVKDELNETSRTIAGYAAADYVEVARDGDGNPKFKPG